MRSRCSPTYTAGCSGAGWTRCAASWRRGGILHATTQGEAFVGALSGEDLLRFRAGELVVVAADEVGKNVCGAFQSVEQVRREIGKGFDVVGHVPGRPFAHSEQDAWLFRRP